MHTTAQYTKPSAPLDARNPELSSRRRTHSSSHAPAVQSHKTIVLHFSNLFLQFSNTLKIGRGILEFYESLFEPYVPEPVRYKTVCSYNFPLYPRYGLYLNACTRGLVQRGALTRSTRNISRGYPKTLTRCVSRSFVKAR